MDESITELTACLENTTIKSFETPLETQLEAQLGLNWADYLALSPTSASVVDIIPPLEPILHPEENKTPSNSNEYFETVDLAEDEEDYEEPVHKHQLTSVGKQPSPLEEQERKRRLEESERKRVEQRLDDQLQLIIKRNRNPSAEDLVYLENAILKKESLLPPRIMKSMSPPVYNLHHLPRGIPGMTTSASTGSLSSLTSEDFFSSCDESEMSSGYTSSELDEMDGLAKKYRQPITMRALNLTIGKWSLKESLKSEEWFSLEVKFLFGRRKIKYEINNRSKSKANLVMEYTFSQINGLDIKPDKRTLIVELAEPPLFASKEKGKISDFTDNQASTHPRHIIEILSVNFDECMDRVRTCDRRLRELAKQGINYAESSFNTPVIETIHTSPSPSTVICDWDNENVAVFHCEECSQNYCSVCDDVLHRHTNKKGHERVSLDAATSPKSKLKNKKRKKSDRCRCGTGATKGTLGEPCTGNRCPCFSNGKSCDNCGCKNCANPIKPKPGNGRPSMNGALHVPSLIVSATANAAAVNRLAPPVITQLSLSPSRHIRHVSM